MCTGCSLCWDFCPRGGTAVRGPVAAVHRRRRSGRDAGGGEVGRRRHVLEAHRRAARRRARRRGRPIRGAGRAQAGRGARRWRGHRHVAGAAGRAATSTVRSVSRPSDDPDEPWKGIATVATTAAEIIAAAGSFYNQTMALAELDLSRYDLAGQAPPGGGGDAVRDPRHPGHAVATVADRSASGRCRRADHRAAVYQELRLRGPDAAGSCATSAASTSSV